MLWRIGSIATGQCAKQMTCKGWNNSIILFDDANFIPQNHTFATGIRF